MNQPAITIKNVLFIMADQLRRDYLGCAGHPTIRTPNIDALATRVVRFANAFVQGLVCGASRMSTYTGRYVTSHGSAWNFVLLSIGQTASGDQLMAFLKETRRDQDTLIPFTSDHGDYLGDLDGREGVVS